MHSASFVCTEVAHENSFEFQVERRFGQLQTKVDSVRLYSFRQNWFLAKSSFPQRRGRSSALATMDQLHADHQMLSKVLDLSIQLGS